jgi:hypothetical protein
MSANASLMLRAVTGLPQGAPPYMLQQAMSAASPAAPVASTVPAVASAMKELTNSGDVYAATEPWRLNPRYLESGLVKVWK